MIKRIYRTDLASSCFFRTSVELPNRKIMIQITEKCNLRCKHCFVDAGHSSNEMSVECIKNIIIPKLLQSKVTKVTLTGGEPLAHVDVIDIIFAFLKENISVSICTNGVLLDYKLIAHLAQHDNIHFNVSLDGFSAETHGKFRGNMTASTFKKIIENIKMLGKFKLLNGILVTPNKYSSIQEYIALCEFAKKIGANYVLMNPLSPFGRGTKTQSLSYTDAEMIELRNKTQQLITEKFEIVYIRFPNISGLPLGECSMGDIPYIFCDGNVAICPYMVFAAQSKLNEYKPEDFILGNIFSNEFSISDSIYNYILSNKIELERCSEDYLQKCRIGCQAIKISQNQPLYSCDYSLCPRRNEYE